MHGYELRKRLNLMLGWGRVLSYGSLYPTLKKMLRGQLIEEAAATPAPVTRRPRIVYQVTEAGHREFERLMSESVPPRGRTTTSTSASPSSAAPTWRSGCACSRAAAPGSRNGWTGSRTSWR